jgi:hypothetical protein
MNLNLIQLFKKIIIDERSFERIVRYSRSRNIQTPSNTEFNDNLYKVLNNFTEDIIKNLQDSNWVPGITRIPLSKSEVQNEFKDQENKIFLDATSITPIYTNYIFSYHIINDTTEKDNALNSLKSCLDSIIKAYDFIQQEKRYFDKDYNIIFNNLDSGLVRRVEARIEEVYDLVPAALFNDQQNEVYDILDKYNLI